MQLAELASLVCTKVGKTDDESIAACKDYLRSRHEMIVDSYPWKDTIALFDVQVAAGSTVAILPQEAARPWAVWDKDSGLEIPVGSLTAIIATNPGDLESVGGLWQFVEIESTGWLYPLAAGGSVLAFINLSLVETTVNIAGERDLNFSGVPNLPDFTDSETFTVGAGGGVYQSLSWKVIHRMTKPAGSGLLVGQLGSIPEPSWAWPESSTEACFGRIRLVQIPQADVTLGVLAKRKLRPMTRDTDAPMVRNIDNALLAFAQADMLERSRQYAKAASKIQEGASLIEGARDLERNQSAKESRIVPVVALETGESWSQW